MTDIVILLEIVIVVLLLKILHNQKPVDERGSPTWFVWSMNALGWAVIIGAGWFVYEHWVAK